MNFTIIQNEELKRISDDITEIRDSVSHLKREKMLSKWLSTDEVCKALKISKRTLQNYRDQNLLVFSQIGRKIIYRKEDIDEFLLNHKIS